MMQCRQCLQEKPEDRFNGFVCEDCVYERQRAWYRCNAELVSETTRNALKNKSTRESYWRHRERNKEKSAARHKVDHINGGGWQHRKEVGGGVAMYQWLKRNGFPKDGFRLLCHNCNQARGAYGKCPHETARQRALKLVPSQ